MRWGKPWGLTGPARPQGPESLSRTRESVPDTRLLSLWHNFSLGSLGEARGTGAELAAGNQRPLLLRGVGATGPRGTCPRIFAH